MTKNKLNNRAGGIFALWSERESRQTSTTAINSKITLHYKVVVIHIVSYLKEQLKCSEYVTVLDCKFLLYSDRTETDFVCFF